MKKVFFNFIFLFLFVLIFLQSSSVKAQAQLTWNQNSINVVHQGTGPAVIEANGCVRMTSSAAFTSGSGMWSKTQVDISKSFTLNFDMFFGCLDSLGGDGMVFVLQNAASELK